MAIGSTSGGGAGSVKPKTPVSTIKSKVKSTPRSADEVSRNLQGAPTATARGIMGLGPRPEMPSGKELNNISNTKAGANKGEGSDPYASMLKALQQLSLMSQGNINTSMDDLTKSLQAQTNPYAGFEAQNTPTTPGLQELLKSQGVSTDPLNQFASAINAQNTGQADAFANIAKTMGGFSDANRTGMISDVAQQRADLLQQLQGNIFGTGSKLMGKKAPDRNAISQMILAMMNEKA